MSARSKSPFQVRAYAGSDVGQVRKGNEDSALVGSTVFAVADGMGGHVAGEVASETALEPLKELDNITFTSDKPARKALVDAIAAANRSVAEKAHADPAYRGMGTTLTAALVREGKLHVAHVGDSRAYLLRDGDGLVQLTTDHTLVEQLIQEGRLSRDEAATHPQRSVITRAIGIEDVVDIDVLPAIALQPGDQILLCSDGLTGPVSDTRITGLLSSTPDGDAACQALIDAANEAGGPDNITVVLLRVDGDAPSSPAAAGAEETDSPTEDLSDAVRATRADAGAATADSTPIRQIRTREESGRDWATSMRDFAAPQGTPQRSSSGSGRGTRLLAVLVAVVVLLGLLAGGAYLLGSRAWFVGDDDGTAAVFRGLPTEVAGLRLARVEERSDIALDDLPPRRAERVRQGITFGTREEAEDFLDTLSEELEEDAEEGAAPDTGPDAGDDTEPDGTSTSGVGGAS